MTAAAAQAGGSAPKRDVWLHGRTADLLLGCGLAYLLSVPLLLGLWTWTGMARWPGVVSSLLVLIISGPHYGATILRVYERGDDVRRYAFFAVWLTLVLGALFVVALHDIWLGSVLLTAYVTWSPWHFAGQNYGVSLLFLRRRGVEVTPLAKRLFYASFVLSFVITFIVLHGRTGNLRFAVGVGQHEFYQVLPIGVPDAIAVPLLPVVLAAYVATLAGAAVAFLRSGSLRDLGPAALLVLMQALWFVVPAMLPLVGDYAGQRALPFAAAWISAAHAIQYLWVTSYFAKRRDPGDRLVPFLGKAMLAGSFISVVPAVLFAPALLGTLSFDGGLAVLLFSVINLHHFVLDGAIWKLRDGRVARTLLRPAPVQAPAGPGAPAPQRGSPWRRAWLAVGAVCLGVALFDFFEREVGVNRAGGDVQRVLTAAERLRWIGRASPHVHARAGELLARRDLHERALAEFDRSLQIQPTARAWKGAARSHEQRGDWASAAEAWAKAAEAAPARDLHYRAGVAAARAGDVDAARHSFEQALALDPDWALAEARLAGLDRRAEATP